MVTGNYRVGSIPYASGERSIDMLLPRESGYVLLNPVVN